MDGNITLKSVLIECLGLIKEEQRLSSKDYNGLVPKEGMEESWDQARRKVQVLKDAIPALESETVRAAMANWQKDVMRDGPSALNVFPTAEERQAMYELIQSRPPYVPKHMRKEDKEVEDPASTAQQTLSEDPMRF